VCRCAIKKLHTHSLSGINEALSRAKTQNDTLLDDVINACMPFVAYGIFKCNNFILDVKASGSKKTNSFVVVNAEQF